MADEQHGHTVSSDPHGAGEPIAIVGIAGTNAHAVLEGHAAPDGVEESPWPVGPLWRPFKDIGDVIVAYVDLAPNAGHEADALGWLDEEERLRWQRFHNPAPQRRFALCRSALRDVLCRYVNCSNEQLAFVAAKHGKPFAEVDGKPVRASFNVSHSGQHGLVAVALKGRLGVDIEDRAPRRHLQGLIEAVFSSGEQAGFEHLDESEKLRLFFRFWTLKEALVKAHGKGHSMKVSEIEIPVAMRRGAQSSICQFPQIPGTTWHLEDIGTDDFAAAVAFEVGSATPACSECQ